MNRESRIAIGLMLPGLAAVLVFWLGKAVYRPAMFALLFGVFLIFLAGTWIVSRPSSDGEMPEGKTRRFRFSIWQVMAASIPIAVFCLVVRELSVGIAVARTNGVVTGPVLGLAVFSTVAGFFCLGLTFFTVWSVLGIFRLASRAGRRR